MERQEDERVIIYIDTNAFIPLVEGSAQRLPQLFALMHLVSQGRADAVTSELTFGELLVGPYAKDADLADAYYNLLSSSPALRLCVVDRETIVRAARLRAAQKSLKLPDAIHLATAELAGCKVFLSDDVDIRPRTPMLRVGLTGFDLDDLVSSLS
jgi:predicted nucleic acid-binding protein